MFENFSLPYVEISEDEIDYDVVEVHYVPFSNIGSVERMLVDRTSKRFSDVVVKRETGHVDFSHQQVPYPIETLELRYSDEYEYEYAVNITKGDDGWYWLEYLNWALVDEDDEEKTLQEQRWFKCDQELGLVECLKNLDVMP